MLYENDTLSVTEYNVIILEKNAARIARYKQEQSQTREQDFYTETKEQTITKGMDHTEKVEESPWPSKMQDNQENIKRRQ